MKVQMLIETVYSLAALPAEGDRVHVLRDGHGRICHSMQRFGPIESTLPRVLIPLDGSTRALRAVEAVIRCIRQFHWAQAVHLLHVQAPLSKEAAEVHFHPRALDAAQRALGLLQQAELGAYLHAAMGETSARIAGLAQELDCAYVLMATQGHTGAASVLLGSVAQAVLARCSVPVTLVR